MFFSTHILADVAEICTQVGIVEAGRLVAQGSLAEIMAQRLKEGGEIEPMLAEMEWCLKENRPYYAEPGRCG